MKPQALSSISMRQKITAGAVIVVVVIIIWQIYGLFGGRSSSAPPPISPGKTEMSATAPGSTANYSPQVPIPKQENLVKQPTIAEQSTMLNPQQQDAAIKYVSALSELQMLRVEREIAETNKAIMSAKLETVTAEKSIVDLLSPPAPQIPTGAYAQGLVNQSAAQQQPVQPTQPSQPEVTYTVISVSQLQSKWNAVLGYQGNLYNVKVGDVLPPDGSKVVVINRNGVILEKDGVTKKISLVPII